MHKVTFPSSTQNEIKSSYIDRKPVLFSLTWAWTVLSFGLALCCARRVLSSVPALWPMNYSLRLVWEASACNLGIVVSFFLIEILSQRSFYQNFLDYWIQHSSFCPHILCNLILLFFIWFTTICNYSVHLVICLFISDFCPMEYEPEPLSSLMLYSQYLECCFVHSKYF